MKMVLRKIEKQNILSKMEDGSIFLNSIEEISNLYEIYYEKKKQEKFPKNIVEKSKPNVL